MFNSCLMKNNSILRCDLNSLKPLLVLIHILHSINHLPLSRILHYTNANSSIVCFQSWLWTIFCNKFCLQYRQLRFKNWSSLPSITVDIYCYHIIFNLYIHSNFHLCYIFIWNCIFNVQQLMYTRYNCFIFCLFILSF